MPPDPLAELSNLVNQQMASFSQVASQTIMGFTQVLTLPLQMIGSLVQTVTQGSGVFSQKMTTSELVDMNIFGTGAN